MDGQTEGYYKILKDILLIRYPVLKVKERCGVYPPQTYQVLPDGSFIPKAL